ncbi:MAG: hypothetical protein COV72_00660 [Candidatus Omnitrophica bacterium CG11_big_fil_rev_8_21_14_0_20_42_13]|uniref:DNA-directed DNA polymerase n=1 Tax=Candidatus Ghiorseimicrobium undicola TaxID=1974746 RepID=A0A2H0LZU3_9BACT|nr:MAG: hypothetical protein COV72_00660 [Candidatus Omnitrophica bacterium CG11_big_fil_rev_8_21_14_0_20_42_13]
MIKSNIYLLIGENEPAKLNKLNSLQNEFLPAESKDFNLETLYAKKLDPNTLQEALLRIPARVKIRVLVVRGVEDLPKNAKDALIDYMRKPSSRLIIILEAKSLGREDINEFVKYAQVMYFKGAKLYDAFTLARAIKSKNQSFALYVLSDLLLRGVSPQMMLGGLIWQWERMQSEGLAKSKIDKGFEFLLEADLNIKTSRLKANTALELLVVKLAFLV